MPAQEIVSRLIDGWEKMDIDQIMSCFLEDASWHNMPYPSIQGRDAIRTAVSNFLSTADHVRFEVYHSGEVSPGIVVNERKDVFRTKDGGTLEIPVMGIFEVQDGLIQTWRDYFDPSVMNNTSGG